MYSVIIVSVSKFRLTTDSSFISLFLSVVIVDFELSFQLANARTQGCCCCCCCCCCCFCKCCCCCCCYCELPFCSCHCFRIFFLPFWQTRTRHFHCWRFAAVVVVVLVVSVVVVVVVVVAAAVVVIVAVVGRAAHLSFKVTKHAIFVVMTFSIPIFGNSKRTWHSHCHIATCHMQQLPQQQQHRQYWHVCISIWLEIYFIGFCVQCVKYIEICMQK